jgi:hypothetical protein
MLQFRAQILKVVNLPIIANYNGSIFVAIGCWPPKRRVRRRIAMPI